MRYLRLKLLKNNKNLKKICHFLFNHNFKNIPGHVMSEVSLKMFCFALFDDGLTLKNFEIGVYRFLNSNSSIHFFSSLCIINENISQKIKYHAQLLDSLRYKEFGGGGGRDNVPIVLILGTNS